MPIKLKTIFFILTIGVVFSRCNKDELEWVRINDLFTVGVNQQIKVIDDRNRTIYVNVAEINENRCPTDAFCIHAGNVLIKVVIEDTRKSQFSTLLCLGDCSPSINNLKSFVFYNIEYTIQLLEVNPVPTTKNQEDKKKVVLKLFRN